MNTKIESVDAYIATFPLDTQVVLNEMRTLIRSVAPDALESIAYGMPAYKTNGKPLVYFGGFKKHIGFYATPTGHTAFVKELSTFKQGKGSVQFPLNKPLPSDLIRAMVNFRVAENKPQKNKP